MVRLNAINLPELSSRVQRPSYSAQQLSTGIVHFGVGGFHRSHQAMYLHRLLNAGANREWGICGVGLLPRDMQMRDVLDQQDYLYTLVTRNPKGQAEAEVIGAIREFLYAPDDPEAVLEKLTQPGTRIVSLTVTEGGYSLNNATGKFDPQGNPDIQHDIEFVEAPRTTFGYLTEALRRRRQQGLAPFTVMSCDNIQGNGEVTRRVLTDFARWQDPELSDWIARQVAFPNSMVDRITPVTTSEMRQQIVDEFSVEDAWPVVAEQFTQWVLEDQFSSGRPALERVGVQMVTDVEPYELMKLRLLNASHQAMAYLGLLEGFVMVHEVCRDDDYVQFLLSYMKDEATPTLKPVPGINLDDYRRQLIDRFSNDAIRDTLSRLIVDASERIPKFLLPVVHEQLARGGELKRCALVVASWCAYINALTADHKLVDPRATELREAAARDEVAPGAFLDLPEIFGELSRNECFRQHFVNARKTLRQLGPREAIRALIPSGGSHNT